MDKALGLDIKGNVDIYKGDSWSNRIYTLIRNKKVLLGHCDVLGKNIDVFSS